MSTFDSTSFAKNNPNAKFDIENRPWNSAITIAGAPRSGTSWLGLVFDSSPSVVNRFQPFFAYASRDRIQFEPLPQQFLSFIYNSDDDFLTQSDQRKTGDYPNFAKDKKPSILAFKTCRHQYLLSRLLRLVPEAKLIAIVRHPAASVNSWLRTSSEFPAGADIRSEWRFGGCKKQGLESEFFGYYKWKELAHMYLDLADQLHDRVVVIRYEEIVNHPFDQIARLFSFFGLEFGQATHHFLAECHQHHSTSPYAVFKDTTVKDAWRHQLPEYIANETENDLEGTRLERFIR